MPKKFKTKTYEKDNDDHYVVVLNPWSNGAKQRTQSQIDWMGAWLRIVFRNPVKKHIVKNIYTVETRSEIIARIDSSVTVEVGLGLHKWGEFMEYRNLEKIRRQTGVDLSEMVSHIFLYNWKLHGDPAERKSMRIKKETSFADSPLFGTGQWQEWFPRQDSIPPNIMINREYPAPAWAEIPPVDTRLRSLLVSMPRIPDLGYDPSSSGVHNTASESKPSGHSSGSARCNEGTVAEINGRQLEVQQENSTGPAHANVFSSYETPLYLLHSSSTRTDSQANGVTRASRLGKVDKLDPFEEDDAARAILSAANVKQETAERIKLETVDVKPDIRSTGYNPSNTLSDSIRKKLRGENSGQPNSGEPAIKREDGLKVEEEDVKPHISNPTDRPSRALAAAVSRLSDDIGLSECKDRKPPVKREDYTPSRSLLDAFSQYSNMSSSGAEQSRNSKRSLENEHSVGSASTDSRSIKRKRTES